MSDGQNDIACLEILTKCIKLMDLIGYMTSIYLLLSKKKTLFFEGKSCQPGSVVVSWNVHLISLFKKGVETNCNESQPLAKKQWKLFTFTKPETTLIVKS